MSYLQGFPKQAASSPTMRGPQKTNKNRHLSRAKTANLPRTSAYICAVAVPSAHLAAVAKAFDFACDRQSSGERRAP